MGHGMSRTRRRGDGSGSLPATRATVGNLDSWPCPPVRTVGRRTPSAPGSAWVAPPRSSRWRVKGNVGPSLSSSVWKDLVGWEVEEGADSQLRAEIELLAGDPEAAERELRWGCDVLGRMGERGCLSTTAGMLANVLASQARLDEAERFIQLSVESGAPDDIRTQVEWRVVKAEVLVRRGDAIRADDLAMQAVEFADRSDELNLRGDARMVLARVLDGQPPGQGQPRRKRGCRAL
jgi:hypothetical protein